MLSTLVTSSETAFNINHLASQVKTLTAVKRVSELENKVVHHYARLDFQDTI